MVYAHLEPPVARLCSRMLGAGPDADDATQEALAKLFAAASAYDATRDALAWALTLATWECRTMRRRRQRARVAPLDDTLLASGSPGPDTKFDDAELAAALEHAVASLRPDDRQVLDEVMADTRGDAAFRKRKQRMLDRLRDLVRRTYDL